MAGEGEPSGEWQARRASVGPLCVLQGGEKSESPGPWPQVARQLCRRCCLAAWVGWAFRELGRSVTWPGEVLGLLIRSGVAAGASREVVCVCLLEVKIGTLSAFQAEPKGFQPEVGHLATHRPSQGLLVPALPLTQPMPLLCLTHLHRSSNSQCLDHPPSLSSSPALWTRSHPPIPRPGPYFLLQAALPDCPLRPCLSLSRAPAAPTAKADSRLPWKLCLLPGSSRWHRGETRLYPLPAVGSWASPFTSLSRHSLLWKGVSLPSGRL